jgi:SAM-dependent methyltransferase
MESSDGQPKVGAEDLVVSSEAERDSRYRWAAEAAAGRTVLDVPCGSGDGTAILAHAGAATALGIDFEEEPVRQATLEHGDIARFAAATAPTLPVASSSFALATCFGGLMGAAAPFLFEELQRVLTGDGVLLASLPASTASSGGLEEELRARFRNVALYRQVSFGGSAVLALEGTAPETFDRVGWPDGSGEGASVLAAASEGPLPDLPPVASFGSMAAARAFARSASAWEERARGAEAEVAVLEWKLMMTDSAYEVMRQRVGELENRPLRRAWRALRGRPTRLTVTYEDDFPQGDETEADFAPGDGAPKPE